jgi:NAD(P)-dependent dehydrogenase (short-subunit alcohol dehydrogenase family)
MRVLLTGGSGGIGNSIKTAFESKGHHVWAPGRDELELSNNPHIENVNYNIVINNAGINPLLSIEDVSDISIMTVNYLSPLSIVQQCLPYMMEMRYGRIVNIGSIWGTFSKKNRSAYSASKSALDSLSRSITSEYAQYNILCNTISPGYIDTPLTHKNNSIGDLERIKENIPIGRLGLPYEIANLVYYLTIENTFITGQNIIIDGGFSCTRI